MTQPAAHDATRPLEFERILSEVRGRLFQQPPAAVRIGRYEVRERLGAGGMGLVYAGVDPELGRRVAIKLVRPELRADADLKASQDRLLREAQAMARVSSPNVVTVYDAGAYGDRVYVAMELVEGATLRSWLIREAPGWRQLVDMYIQAGNGLAAVHAAGLVHRDFKPENVLIGGDGRARVADFGLAHAGHAAAATTASARGFASAGVGVTSTGQVAGSAAYMAAERHRGEPADPRSDQFSFCVALWEALYGARPFAGESVSEVRDSILAGVITAPPSSARV
ncbi:MAG: serine/threonine-protein kinase, partial [Nannocystaceae bacterium]